MKSTGIQSIEIVARDIETNVVAQTELFVKPGTNPAALIRFGIAFRQTIELINLPPLTVTVDGIEVK